MQAPHPPAAVAEEDEEGFNVTVLFEWETQLKIPRSEGVDLKEARRFFMAVGRTCPFSREEGLFQPKHAELDKSFYKVRARPLSLPPSPAHLRSTHTPRQDTEAFFKKVTEQEARVREGLRIPTAVEEELKQARECCKKLAVWGGLWAELPSEKVRTGGTPLFPPSCSPLAALLLPLLHHPSLQPDLPYDNLTHCISSFHTHIHTHTHTALRTHCKSYIEHCWGCCGRWRSCGWGSCY